MIKKEKYTQQNGTILWHIYSSRGFFIQYDAQLFKDAYVKEDEIMNYIETNIPLPSVRANNDFICNQLIVNNQLTENEILAAKPIIEKALNALDKDDTYYVKFLFPVLDITREYQIGERFQYENNIYQTIQIGLGRELLDENASDFFEKIALPGDFLPEWMPNTTYNQEDRVLYGEHIYESLINGNNWSPKDFPTSWKLIEGSQA